MTISLQFQELECGTEISQKRRVPHGIMVIYSAGGYLKHSLNSLECFNPETGEWSVLKELPNPKSGAGAAFVGESSLIFVVPISFDLKPNIRLF